MARDYGEEQFRREDDSSNPWSQYRRLILQRLERIDNDLGKLEVKQEVQKDALVKAELAFAAAMARAKEKVDEEISRMKKDFDGEVSKMKKDIVSLQTKAGFIGAISGAILTGIVEGALKLFSRH
jgi:hypothetical protein